MPAVASIAMIAMAIISSTKVNARLFFVKGKIEYFVFFWGLLKVFCKGFILRFYNENDAVSMN
jgi:hypothetical protein